MKKWMPGIASLLSLAVILYGCAATETREEYLKAPKNNIVLGLTYPFRNIDSSTYYLQGIELAVDEVNANGGVFGRKLQLLPKDDGSSVTTGAEAAQAFVEDPSVAAVIGHWNSSVSIPAASIYNSGGLLMITPASTSPRLTEMGYGLVFRKVPGDTIIGGKLAELVHGEGLKRVVVYYSDDDYGRGLANTFEDSADNLGMQVVDRITTVNVRELPRLLNRWKALQFDSLVVADVMPAGGDFINKIRQAGIDAPVFSATGLDRLNTAEVLGRYAKDVTVISLFNPNDQRPEVKQFVESFKAKYGKVPDTWAAQGYDTVKLIAYAMQKANSALPQKVAEEFKKMKEWDGVTGVLGCSAEGEIAGNAVYGKSLLDGKYTGIN